MTRPVAINARLPLLVLVPAPSWPVVSNPCVGDSHNASHGARCTRSCAWAPRRAQRFTPSGAAATCSAIALAPVAARADEHLAPALGTQKQAGIVHCSPRRGGLDDPRLPGNTALGAVRQCGSGRSLGRDRQVDVVREAAPVSPTTAISPPTAERRHHTGAPRRHLLIGNSGSGGRQRQAPGRGTGTTQSSSAPIPQSQFTRAVRRITALSQSRLQSVLISTALQ